MSESQYSKKSFDAVRIEDQSENPKDWSAGQFYTVVNQDGKIVAIDLCLPNKLDRGLHWGACSVYLEGEDKPETPSWKWNGDIDRPTLLPSIHATGHWHGYLTDGYFKSQ